MHFHKKIHWKSFREVNVGIGDQFESMETCSEGAVPYRATQRNEQKTVEIRTCSEGAVPYRATQRNEQKTTEIRTCSEGAVPYRKTQRNE